MVSFKFFYEIVFLHYSITKCSGVTKFLSHPLKNLTVNFKPFSIEREIMEVWSVQTSIISTHGPALTIIEMRFSFNFAEVCFVAAAAVER